MAAFPLRRPAWLRRELLARILGERLGYQVTAENAQGGQEADHIQVQWIARETCRVFMPHGPRPAQRAADGSVPICR